MAGCGGGADADDESRPTVVTTTTMIEDLASVIGGEEVNVIGIMRSGEDPHLYEPKGSDATAIRNADLVLMNGLNLEASLGDIADKNTVGLVVRLAEDERIKPISKPGFESVPDPHCWMDLDYFCIYAEKTRDALIETAPEHEQLFRERTEGYLKELEALGQWVHEQIQQIPEGRRVLITAHDAFAYYGKAYGIEVHGLIGISTEAQMRPGDIQRVEKLIRERGLPAVFVESSTEGALNDQVRKIAERTGVSVSEEKLHSDSLDEKGKPAGTYLGMMRHNTRTIVEALKGAGE